MRKRYPLSVYIATAGGLGFFPFMPGTLGSAAACAVSWFFPVPLWVILAVTAAGVWASNEAERILNRKDPGCVIIDEVAGMWLSVLFLPHSFLLGGFLLFRVLDILKPFPICRMERLPGGWGIMADDIVGGLMANLILQALNACLFRAGWLSSLLTGFTGAVKG
ncbi:MAG: phosphatidylglycerophosphatase A [Fretibacterium sp.]|nr:phosphatidylglycerophosphatase A [Fretibacterium sp.]